MTTDTSKVSDAKMQSFRLKIFLIRGHKPKQLFVIPAAPYTENVHRPPSLHSEPLKDILAKESF